MISTSCITEKYIQMLYQLPYRADEKTPQVHAAKFCNSTDSTDVAQLIDTDQSPSKRPRLAHPQTGDSSNRGRDPTQFSTTPGSAFEPVTRHLLAAKPTAD